MASTLTLAYREGDSFFHRCDPLSKLLYVISVSLLIVLGGLVQQFVLVLVAVPFSYVAAGTPWRRYWAIIKFVVFFGFTIGVTSALFIEKPGPVVLSTPVRNFSYHELTDGFAFGLKLMTLAFTSLAFVFTTHPRDFANSLVRRGLSYRLAHGFVLALVFLPILLAEGGNVRNAHRIRNFGARDNPLFRRMRGFQHLVVALVARSVRRAETLAVAMEVKGFGMAGERTHYHVQERFIPGEVMGVVSLVVTVVLALTIWRN